MKKQILFTTAGTVLIILSIVLLYFYLTSLQTGGNIFMLVGTFASLGVAVFSCIQATKPAPIVDEMPFFTKADADASIVQKNNAMATEYNRTAKAREELRMLELAGSAGKDK